MFTFWERDSVILCIFSNIVFDFFLLVFDVFDFFLLIWKISQCCSIVDFLFFIFYGNPPGHPTFLLQKPVGQDSLFAKVLWSYTIHVIWCSQPTASIWDFELGAGDGRKQGKMRIYSCNLAAQAVSAVASNVPCSASSAVVSSVDGICDMILVVILAA